ncbi:hypothetical protein B484DRAFT_440741 [Ochromonadaceae sp. CCMP2298]|nr:hypothetical protein B484DRAFT_440741 [Ochromonadaceae sp. CCMP2298]
MSLASILEEIGEPGLIRLLGWTADNHGLKELRLILEAADDLRIREGTKTSAISVQSLVCVDLVYRYGRVAEQRALSCMMHSPERIQRPFLYRVMEPGGVSNDATTCRYSCMYQEGLYALMLESLGCDISQWGELPKEVRQVFGQITSARWVSQERSCYAFIALMDVPASTYVDEMVAEYYDGGGEEWDAVADYFTCFFDASKLSHVALIMLYIANHSPGGASGEEISNIPQMVAFMASPYQRAGVKITAALYAVHMEWARFADGRSKVDPASRCMSLRMV